MGLGRVLGLIFSEVSAPMMFILDVHTERCAQLLLHCGGWTPIYTASLVRYTWFPSVTDEDFCSMYCTSRVNSAVWI
jgi:hypothetical protein